jgi:hypothetical protein
VTHKAELSLSAQWSSPLHTENSIKLLSITCIFNVEIAVTHKAELSFQLLPNMMFTRLALKTEASA